MREIFIFIMCMSTILGNGQNFIYDLKSGKILEEQIEYSVFNQARSYNKTEAQLLIFYPNNKAKENLPVVVICPGGGYEYLSMYNEGREVAKWLTKMGIAAAVYKYPLPSGITSASGTFDALQYGEAAISSLRENSKAWNLDDKKIGIIGFSAGGHLAGSISNSRQAGAQPDFSILIYPVLSMDDEITHQGTKQKLLDGQAGMEELFSVENLVSEQTPPTFLLHSMDDRSVSIENSLRYFERLRAFGVSTEFHAMVAGGHGYGLAMDRSNMKHWSINLEKWLERMIK